MEHKNQLLNLTDKDLRQNINTYDSDQIVYSILRNQVNLRTIVKTQKLTPYICAKYIIFGGKNEEYGTGQEDRWIDDEDIIRLQPHITKQDLIDAHIFVVKEEKEELRKLNDRSNNNF
jgi:hypothetical protein